MTHSPTIDISYSLLPNQPRTFYSVRRAYIPCQNREQVLQSPVTEHWLLIGPFCLAAPSSSALLQRFHREQTINTTILPFVTITSQAHTSTSYKHNNISCSTSYEPSSPSFARDVVTSLPVVSLAGVRRPRRSSKSAISADRKQARRPRQCCSALK